MEEGQGADLYFIEEGQGADLYLIRGSVILSCSFRDSSIPCCSKIVILKHLGPGCSFLAFHMQSIKRANNNIDWMGPSYGLHGAS